jgi:hypothetical protein
MKKNISHHDHPMHKGPHHEKYIHEANRLQVPQMHSKGEHELGDKNHIESLKGEPHGADVTGHDGRMHW